MTISIRTNLIRAAIAAAALSLTACGPLIVLAPAGGYAVGAAGATTLDRPWNDATGLLAGYKKVRLLTQDGLLLNRLYLTEGLVQGDHIVPPAQRREATTPTYSTAMSVTEQVEFVADSVAALGYERVETTAPRPVTINGHRGVRFDFTAVNADGLNYKGVGQAVKKDDRLFVAIYLATEEHYFAASLPSATATMDALTFN